MLSWPFGCVLRAASAIIPMLRRLADSDWPWTPQVMRAAFVCRQASGQQNGGGELAALRPQLGRMRRNVSDGHASQGKNEATRPLLISGVP